MPCASRTAAILDARVALTRRMAVIWRIWSRERILSHHCVKRHIAEPIRIDRATDVGLEHSKALLANTRISKAWCILSQWPFAQTTRTRCWLGNDLCNECCKQRAQLVALNILICTFFSVAACRKDQNRSAKVQRIQHFQTHSRRLHSRACSCLHLASNGVGHSEGEGIVGAGGSDFAGSRHQSVFDTVGLATESRHALRVRGTERKLHEAIGPSALARRGGDQRPPRRRHQWATTQAHPATRPCRQLLCQRGTVPHEPHPLTERHCQRQHERHPQPRHSDIPAFQHPGRQRRILDQNKKAQCSTFLQHRATLPVSQLLEQAGGVDVDKRLSGSSITLERLEFRQCTKFQRRCCNTFLLGVATLLGTNNDEVRSRVARYTDLSRFASARSTVRLQQHLDRRAGAPSEWF